jgi:GPH family glycoside/pentoside/hexuronide:cation symporter
MRLSTKIGYGIGQTSDGIKQVAFSTFLFFYYNQVLGLSGGLAGSAALLALFVDAITDPMVGQYSDRFRSRWGRRHPFMLLGALTFGIALYILFTPPAGLGEYGLFYWMLGWAICVRLTLTLFYVPHLSLGAEMVKDYHQRTALISYRMFFGYLGGFLLTIIGFIVFFPKTEAFANGLLNVESYPAFGLFAGIFATLTMLWSIFSTRSEIPRLSQPIIDPNSKHPLLAFITVFSTLRLHSFKILFFTILLFMIMAGITQTLIIYIASYLFGFSTDQMAILVLAQLLSIITAPLVAKKLSAVFDKKNTLAITICIGAVIGYFPIMMYWVGEFQTFTMNNKLIVAFFCSGISQAFFIAYLIIFDSMLSDTIDEHELATGRREEGLFFAARSFAFKASFGIGAFVAGIVLEVIKFPKGMSPNLIPPEALMNLAIFAGPISLALTLSTILISRKYKLNETRHNEIRDEIKLRQLKAEA